MKILAVRLGLSSSYLREQCWLYFNVSPRRLIETLKMEFALKLLLDNGHNLYETCRLTGYKNVKTFRNQFRKRFDMTPAEFKSYMEKGINIEEFMEKIHMK